MSSRETELKVVHSCLTVYLYVFKYFNSDTIFLILLLDTSMINASTVSIHLRACQNHHNAVTKAGG